MNENEKKNEETLPSQHAITLSRSAVWMCTFAVAYVVIHLGIELVDYLQADAVRTGRVITRSLGILGWCGVLFVLIKQLWNGRKR